MSAPSARTGQLDEANTAARGIEDLAQAPLVPKEGLFEGQIAVVGRTLIDGTVQGSLRGPGDLYIGPDARVEGPIECAQITSQGEIIGSVVAHTRARLGSSARFEGDMDAEILEVDDEAVWNGRARVGAIPGQDPGQE